MVARKLPSHASPVAAWTICTSEGGTARAKSAKSSLICVPLALLVTSLPSGAYDVGVIAAIVEFLVEVEDDAVHLEGLLLGEVPLGDVGES